MKYNPVIMFLIIFVGSVVLINTLAVSGYVPAMKGPDFAVVAFMSVFWATVGYFFDKHME